MYPEEHIVLFDGICNLCNSGVRFIIKHDKKAIFKFAALQSELGEKLLTNYQLDTKSMDSFVYIQQGKAYIKSTAALKIAKELKRGWQLFYLFIIVPTIIRDGVYSFVAQNRHRWFGKKESCMIPTPALKARFLS